MVWGELGSGVLVWVGLRLRLWWEWVLRGDPQRLTSLVHEELVEIGHPFQAGALGSLIWVLAQNPQHAHQLPNSSEVLFGL